VSNGLENVQQVVTKGVGYLTERSTVTLIPDTNSSTH
jgi:hypothetical protein